MFHTPCIIVPLQEEELDELAGQVQMLESARLRLEMAMEQMRKENKKELAQREEEMEDTRCSAQKKVKGKCTQTDKKFLWLYPTLYFCHP